MTAKKLTLPFAHLNLQRNPFGEVTAEDWVRLAVVQVDSFREPLGRPGFAVQFVGETGRGKTTHLLALRAHFPEAPYIHIGEGEPPALPDASLLFLDEVQRLPRAVRARLFFRRASFALGSHEDHADELRRCRLVFETMQLRGLSGEHLRAIIERRIEWARRGPGRVPRVGPITIRALLERFGDDRRAIQAHLYDVFQRLEQVGDVQV